MDAFIIPFLILISLLLIIINFWCGHKYISVISSFFLFLALMLSLTYLVSGLFTGKGIDESVIFHILYALDKNTILNFKELFILAISIIILSLIWLIWFNIKRIQKLIKKKKYGSNNFNIFLSSLLLLFSMLAVFAHPATTNLYDLYILSTNEKRFSEFENHIKPIQVNYNPNNTPKNFIYIYVESLERTFLDQGRFPNLAPHLNQLKHNSVFIEGIKQAPMTNWTIAGMTASQCGIPLATYSKNQAAIDPNLRNNELDKLDTFLPGAICLGDILRENKYYLSYIGGADKEFAGKGNFYSDHGFNEVAGKSEILSHYNHDLPLSKWGVYDDALYDYLFEKFEAIATTHDRFGLIALTLDTHAPLGHETPKCKGKKYKDGSIKMLNSISCADYLISNFIYKFNRSPYSKNTVLIIASDHLMMMNDIGLEIDDSSRENLWMAINTDLPPQLIKRQATTLDIVPTVLTIIGFDTQDFALGRNLLSNQPTLYEKLGEDDFYTQLQSWRMGLWKYWKNETNEVERYER